jgi:hypothetical protein
MSNELGVHTHFGCVLSERSHGVFALLSYGGTGFDVAGFSAVRDVVNAEPGAPPERIALTHR